MKMLWIEPQITEVKIEMTQSDNKNGLKTDEYSPALCGEKIPCPTCS